MSALTVILPVRNGAATVASAVTSTLRALPADARLLVHDDASTDATGAVLAGIGDPRLTVLRSETARGVAGGLNHLLEHVETTLVARMDADDLTLPWRFRAAQRALGTGVGAVFSTVVGFGDVGWPGFRPGPPLPIGPRAMPLHLLLANPVAHSTMVARTAVLRAVGGYQPVPSEDYDLWLRLTAGGVRLARLGLPALLYRFHAAQVTASADWVLRSLADDTVRRSYSALAERVLGRTPDWLDALRAPADERDPGALEPFRDAMVAAAGRLSPLERRFLLRKLDAATR